MRDALAEMACTLAGGFLRRLLPPGEPFTLGTVDVGTPHGFWTRAGTTPVAFSTGAHRFWVALEVPPRARTMASTEPGLRA